ncbi:hypothetical protein D3C85_1816360 [compost metagenome]
MGHRQVEVVALAYAAATFVGKASDTWVKVGGVTVHRHVQDVVTFVEDFLDTLTMVHVGVEHGYTAKALA